MVKECIQMLQQSKQKLQSVFIDSLKRFKDEQIQTSSLIFDIGYITINELGNLVKPILNEYKEQINDFFFIQIQNAFPTPDEFQQLPQCNQSNRKKKLINLIWPEFLVDFDIHDDNLVNFADQVQIYLDKLTNITTERQKILKIITICEKQLLDTFEKVSKVLKSQVDNHMKMQFSQILGYQKNNIYVIFKEIFTELSEYMSQIKVKDFQSSLMQLLDDLEKEKKIVLTALLFAFKNHNNIKNQLLRFNNQNNRIKQDSKFSQEKQALIDKTRQSIQEFGELIKTLIFEFVQKEYDAVISFRLQFENSLNVQIIKKFKGKVFQLRIQTIIPKLVAMKYFKSVIIRQKIPFHQQYLSKFHIHSFKETSIKTKIWVDEVLQFKQFFDPQNHPFNQINESNNNLQQQFDETYDESMVKKETINKNNSASKKDNTNEFQGSQIPISDFLQEISKFGSNSSINQNSISINKIQYKHSDDQINETFQEQSNSSLNFQNDQNSDSQKINIQNKQPQKQIEIHKSEKKNSLKSNDDLIQDLQKQIKPTFDEKLKNGAAIFKTFEKTFGTVQNEILYKCYSCALVDKILLQGQIYITNKRLCFYSYFNSQNLFFGGTKMIIPAQDIILIQKRQNTLFFDNSISVKTPKGEITFSSFSQLEKFYQIIINMIKPSQQQDLKNNEDSVDKTKNPENDTNMSYIVQVQTRNIVYFDEKIQLQIDFQEQLHKRFQRINSQIETNFSEKLIYNQQINVKCTSDDAFRIMFQKFEFEGKSYEGFHHYQRVAQTDFDIKYSGFKPNPPDIFVHSTNPQQLLDFEDFSVNEITYQKNLNLNIPFVPNVCSVQETIKAFWIDYERILFQTVIQVTKAPYSDCFQTILQQDFQMQKNQTLLYTIRVKVNFIKSTMMKSTIQSQNESQCTSSIQKIIFPNALKIFPEVLNSKQYKEQFRNNQDNSQTEIDQNKNLAEQENLHIQQINNELNQTVQKLTLDIGNLQHKFLLAIILISIMISIQLSISIISLFNK